MSTQLVNPPGVPLDLAFDREAPVPMYYQLKEWLSGRILSGDLTPGEQLPGELELSVRLHVSRGVVRQALSELRHDGLVDRRRGKGTFVAAPKTAEGLISGLRGLADDALLRGSRIESTVLVLRERPPDPTVARRLELGAADRVVELGRLRSLDGEPHVLVTTFLPAALVPGLVDCDLGGTESLYRVLREGFGLPVVSCTRRVEASVADARQAHLLRIRCGDPLLVLRSTAYTTGRRPLEYFVASHRADRTAFEVELEAATAVATRFDRVPLEAHAL
jgi:GntR family transcriptional regulator